jgi:hypothetical protein
MSCPDVFRLLRTLSAVAADCFLFTLAAMNFPKTLLLLASFLLLSVVSHAAGLAGKWTANFESQVGPQKYVYDFTGDGDKLSGKASFERSSGKGESPLKDIKVTGEDVSFVEQIKINDMDITVTYKGTIKGDELNLTRTVGDYGAAQITAKRSPAEAGKP